MSPNGPWAESDVIAVLELLASEAPLDRFDTVVSEASQKGATVAELEALERAKRLGLSVYSRLDRRQRREAGLSALVDTARDLATSNNLDTLLKVITRRARMLLASDMSYISLPDEEHGFFYVHTSDGHTSTLNVGLRLPPESGLGNAVLADPAPIWTPDYLTDERIQHSEAIDRVVRAEGLHAIMAVPLSYGTRPFGILYVADRKVRHFTADERSLMSSLGDLAGVAIKKARLLDQTMAVASGLKQHVSQAEAGLKNVRELSDNHNRLFELVLSGGDLDALAEEASKRLGGALQITADNGTVLTSAGEVTEFDKTAVVVATMEAHAAREPVPLDDGLWVAPIVAGDDDLGTLVLFPRRELTDRDLELVRLITQAAAVLLLLRTSKTEDAAGQVREELMNDMLTLPHRPGDQLGKRARRLGYDLDKPHVVVVARPEGKPRGKMGIWACSYAYRGNGIKTTQHDMTVFLLPGTDAAAAARALLAELEPLVGAPVTVAGAGPVTGPDAVPHTYQEALRCLDAITALGAKGRSASASELGFLGLLLSHTPDVEGFIESAIGPVLDYDRERFTELARTLDAYFEVGASPTYAAEKLHVHPNTVARRLERISELLGPQWQKPDRALDIHLALRLSRIRRVLLERPLPQPGDQVSAADYDT
ncbi:helix-turn-helix domain-containing protein [Amycolatopsis nigrescens]|uniref:helix-turn-helix domain-containing protein n=1 Tax=Amycolatopsis nigrescens TaxID=381445 RepID=UPI0003767A8F|nr:GAF domain-containing protein [Amycolatopsis nigrescens]